MRKREVQRCQSQLVSPDCMFSIVLFFKEVPDSGATGCVDTTLT